MPNQPKTRLRAVRIDDGLWQQARERAAERGESVSQVIRRALEQYVR